MDHIEDWERELIGKEVLATMDGKLFTKGILLAVNDFFAAYELDMSGETRHFVSIKEE